MKVNLFILGACKAGTSYLHDLLDTAPGVLMSRPKEPYFFEREILHEDADFYHRKYFGAYAGENLVGEARHRNMFFSWIPEQIHRYNPGARLIFSLRNPVERAYSHWWMWYSRRIIDTPFRETLEKNRELLERGGSVYYAENIEAYQKYVAEQAPQGRSAYADALTLLETGHYAEQIERFLRFFPKEQMLFIDFEKIKQPACIRTLLEENLGVQLPVEKKEDLNQNASSYRRKPPALLKRIARLNIVPRQLKQLYTKNVLSKPALTSGDRKWLNAYYHEHNRKLKELTGLDFVEGWGP